MNDIFKFWGHKFIYDRHTLRTAHERNGFTNVRRKKFGPSDYEELRNRERHADSEWTKEALTILEVEKEEEPRDHR